MNNILEITIVKPDDFHVHLRDGEALMTTVIDACKQFSRITVMPNLKPAVSNTELAISYLSRIKQYIPNGCDFTPLMTLYLTSDLTTEEIKKAHSAGIKAVKFYPQGATTNSAQGVADLLVFKDVFNYMAELGMLLLVHGEVADSDVDIFAREHRFLIETAANLTKQHPNLKIVFEHITTQQAVDFVSNSSNNVAATITPQHLLANRNTLLSGGIKPHYYCLPILKKESDRVALLDAATSGNPKFFLGTDSAPHSISTKESACGCAGCYSMPYAIEYYAHAFDSIGKIDKLNDFSSRFGAEFYGLDLAKTEIGLIRQSQVIAKSLPYLGENITPLMAEQTLNWQIQK